MEKSFKERVKNFWLAFEKEEAEVRKMMDDKVEGETLLKFVSSILDIAFTNSYFEMGVNGDGKYELILTPEGNRAKLMQLHYWLQQAPESLSEYWNFYSSKPGHPDSNFGMQMYDISLSKEDVNLYYSIDDERRKVDIEIYCPPLIALEENKRYNMFFIFLDQFIGELYTMEYIGYVDFVEEKQDKPIISIGELKALIDETIDEKEWTRIDNPCELYSGYQMEPSEEDDWTLRQDIMSGYTSCIPVLNAFYNGDETYFADYASDGLTFGFLFFNNNEVPKDKIVYFRGEVEDKILAQAEPMGIANSIGGATGFHFSYIDFIIYDMDAFLNVVKEVLASYNFEESGFSDFAQDKDPIVF